MQLELSEVQDLLTDDILIIHQQAYPISEGLRMALEAGKCTCGHQIQTVEVTERTLTIFGSQSSLFGPDGQCIECRPTALPIPTPDQLQPRRESTSYSSPPSNNRNSTTSSSRPSTTTSTTRTSTTSTTRNSATSTTRRAGSVRKLKAKDLLGMELDKRGSLVDAPRKLPWQTVQSMLKTGYTARAADWNETQCVSWDDDLKLFIMWDNGNANSARSAMKSSLTKKDWILVRRPYKSPIPPSQPTPTSSRTMDEMDDDEWARTWGVHMYPYGVN